LVVFADFKLPSFSFEVEEPSVADLADPVTDKGTAGAGDR
jgi:hypothetical protein